MSRFELTHSIRELKLKHVFTISRGSKNSVKNVFIQLSKNGITGLGEAAPNKRYNESAELVTEELENFDSSVLDDIDNLNDIERILDEFTTKLSASTKVAIEMAWLDWWGKTLQKPLYKLLGYTHHHTPSTSYTIGIDSLEVMREKVKEASSYPILKIKLGTERDREIIKAIRSITKKPIRVDANEGWKTIDQAKREIEFLTAHDIEMVEQPMPSYMLKEMELLKKFSPISLCADESFIGEESLDKVSLAFDCINIKLMKIGSVLKAMRVLEKAHQLGLKVMVGCMVESSLAIGAGALVGLGADYVDLDGNLLIVNDPFKGQIKLSKDCELVLPNHSPGMGLLTL